MTPIIRDRPRFLPPALKGKQEKRGLSLIFGFAKHGVNR